MVLPTLNIIIKNRYGVAHVKHYYYDDNDDTPAYHLKADILLPSSYMMIITTMIVLLIENQYGVAWGPCLICTTFSVNLKSDLMGFQV